jgi:hypothetical protein
MEHASHKMEHLIQRQKQLLQQSQADAESQSTRDKAHYAMAIGGVAAGLTIAVIAWLANSVLTTSRLDTGASERSVAVQSGEIAQLNDSIARLSGRVESLTVSVSDLGSRFTRLMELTESIARIGTQHPSTPQSLSDSTSSPAIQASNESAQAFLPTHIVKTRVNLRPAASLNSAPVTVLDVGTKVEYLSKSDGWYYVNTQSHGKGWCSSDHLSPWSSREPKSAAR